MRNTKRGSYIVEAALSMPVLILCITAIALIINIIAICENIGFSSAEQMHKICSSAYIAETGEFSHGIAVQKAVASDNPKLRSFTVTGFRYRYTKQGVDDLIGLQTKSSFTVANPIGINGNIIFTQRILARAFTGKLENAEPLAAGEFQKNGESVPVVVFPRYGIRFHAASCRYAKQKYGEQEYKIEMEREDAKAKGYTPCLVCGGGKGGQ